MVGKDTRAWTWSASRNNLKTTSSRLVRREYTRQLSRVYRKPVFWSRSYCIISCGGAPLSVITQCVEQQKAPACAVPGAAFTPRLYVPSTNEATHPRCSVEGCPDGPGRASYMEGESWGI